MRYLKSSLLGGVLAISELSNATPVSRELRGSSVLQARANPSNYPGTGTIFRNEWQYLNFDMENTADKASVEIIHQAFDGMRRLALAGLSSAIGNDLVYQRFFPAEDGEDPIRQKGVIPVLRQIIPEELGDGSQNTLALVGPLLAKLVIDNEDFNKDVDNAAKCGDAGTLAYTDADTGHVHFCAAGLALQDTGVITCQSKLDDFVSDKMDSMGRIALHEALHVNTIGEASLNHSIVDINNKDGKAAFGPERAFALVHGDPGDIEPVEEGTGEDPAVATSNADNYAWQATNAFIAQKGCKQGNFKDPEDYDGE